MTVGQPASDSQRPPLRAEMIRAIFAGISMGTATGIGMGALYGLLLPDGPGYSSAASEMFWIGLGGAVLGCLHGLGAGITVGVTLRLMRHAALPMAVVAACLTACATVAVIIQSIIGTFSEGEPFSILLGAFAGIVAALATRGSGAPHPTPAPGHSPTKNVPLHRGVLGSSLVTVVVAGHRLATGTRHLRLASSSSTGQMTPPTSGRAAGPRFCL